MIADLSNALIGNRYRPKAQLGRGGMGAVYRADDRLTGLEVALKRVTIPTEQLQFASLQSNASTASTSTASLRMALAQEFHTLASLRHPNIIHVFDYGFDAEQQPYLAMDLLHNPRTIIEAGRDQPQPVKIDLLIQMLQAIAYLHRRGVVHRDLKPDNVVVILENGAPRVRVLDFGLALTPEYLNTQSRGFAGTLAYMAPEILQGGSASIASDLYAVGVMAFELMIGRHPFRTASVTEMINNVLKHDPDFTPLASTQLAIDPAEADAYRENLTLDVQELPNSFLTEIIARLLSKYPDDRYSDAYDVIADLCAATGIPMPEESDAIRESFLQAARFVGRSAELAQLRSALDDAHAGRGSLWLVGGESGVGKSRLLEELRTRALIAGMITLNGQAVTSGALPYQLWRNPLRRLLLSTPVTPQEASILSTILPDIGALVENVPASDGVDAQQRLIRTIIDLFRRQNQPLVLLLEDLQWVSESLEVLKRLAPFVYDLPLLIIGSYRDDERPNLPADLPQARVLALQRLSSDEIAELTLSMLGESGQHNDVVDFVQRETEGNAFFLVETVRALAEEAGSLTDIGRATLPPRLHAGGIARVIWRRLSRVPPSAQMLLKLAAVVGRELDLPLMQLILESPASQAIIDYPVSGLDNWLTICANRAVFEMQDGSWRFAHDKLREALLDSLSDLERAAFHYLSAEAIEAAYPDDLDRFASALAGHWREAGNQRQEGYYTQIAARQANHNNAYREAERLFLRALEIRAYADSPNPRAAEAELQHDLGRALYNMSEYGGARQRQNQSLELFREIGDRHGIAEAINALGEVDMRQGLTDQAQAQLEQALAIRRELGILREIGYSYMNLGVVETQRDHWEAARDLFAQCLDVMEQDGSPRDLARALNNYANTLDVLGSKEQARELHLRALAIREQEHDLHGICFSLLNLGLLEFDLNHYDKSRELLLQAQRLAEQVVDRMALAAITATLGDVSMKLDDYTNAQQYYERGIELRKAIGDRGGIATSTAQLGAIARELGKNDEALQHFQTALALSVSGDLQSQIWETLHELALFLIKLEKRRSALKLLAFMQTHRPSPSPIDTDLMGGLETSLPEHAVASAVALGEALTLDTLSAKIAAGDLEF